MGNYIPFPLNRQMGGDVEDFNVADVTTYRFRPVSKTGSYFADHFIMAGEKFENMNQESFLFGENNDLNYLPSRPTMFPYQISNENEPSKTIRSFVHLRKDSLKLVKEDTVASSEDFGAYRIEFLFDADLDCAVQIFLMATEEFSNKGVMYHSRNPLLVSQQYRFEKGVKKSFSSRNFIIKPTDFTPSELNFIPDGYDSEIPLVIQITVEDPDFLGQSESTMAGIETLSEGLYAIKFLKQKIMVNGVCFITQEIYGIENKTKEQRNMNDDDFDDNAECVICMGNLRDTIMLPCRHLCLCNDCAEQMRTKQSRCPICRANFHALLQIKAVRKESPSSDVYQKVHLIEALNGDIQLEGDVIQTTANKTRTSSARSRRSGRRSAKVKAPCTEADAAVITSDNQETTDISPADEKPNCEKDTESTNLDEENIEKKELQEIVVDAGPPSTVAIETKPNEHVDASLPGTPMGSDNSADSSLLRDSLIAMNLPSTQISTRVQITTPSNIQLSTLSAAVSQHDVPEDTV